MNGTWKDIEELAKELREAADNLRANSKLTSNDYFMPVLGLIFLRHAANRFAAAQKQIEADQAAGRMRKRKVISKDYVRRRALWLPAEARYDWIMEQAATRASDLPPFVANGSGAGQDGDALAAAATELREYSVALPPDGILAAFSSVISPVVEQLRLLTFANQKLRAARDLLLPRLMSGELAV